MNILECMKVSLTSIFSNKLRTILTILGIIIGIASVIIIVTIGKGGQAAVIGELEKLGINAVNIRIKPGASSCQNNLMYKDAQNIKEYITEAQNVAPVFNGFGVLKRNGKGRQSYIWGIDKQFKSIYSLELLHGRMINDTDTRTSRDVVIIDNVTAKKMFHRENVVGKTIKLTSKNKTIMLKIIGVIKSSSEVLDDMFGEQIPVFIYMPITTLQKIYNVNNVDFISVKIEPSEDIDNAGIKIVRFLERIHNNNNVYYVENLIKQREKINSIASILTFIIGAIGAVSLIVGGIGVMNIMLVSVTERTREIGIRKALGAKTTDILSQFLTEAVILTSSGGIIGILSGIFFSWLISYFSGLPLKFSITTILIALLFSSVIGLIFGVYPASKAAKLDPIEALRYE